MSHINNLTALRWIAASLVMYGHAFIFLGLPEPRFLGWVSLGPLGVYVFFGISGYLVAQSWESDPNVWRFLQRRALRIFPGLIVCTFLTVLILGPLLTTLPISAYFRSENAWSYFSNIFLYITYHLPGVFGTNTYPGAVNGSLWSLPAEFAMYILLALVGVSLASTSGWVFTGLAIMLASKFWAMEAAEQLVVYRTDLRGVLICGSYFWVGVIFFKYRIARFFNATYILGCVAAWLSLSRWPEVFVIASWFALPFLTLAFGLACDPWLARMSRFDYSYGIYIYAFPIQQAIVSFWPQLPIGYLLASSALATLVLASLSWHWIEHPALRLKPKRARSLAQNELFAAPGHRVG